MAEAGGNNFTGVLAAFSADLEWNQLPAEVVHQAERLILDTCCCAVGGYALDNSKKFVHAVAQMGGRQEATVVGTHIKCPSSMAAFANTQMANALDLDDALLYQSHLANTAVMPAMAVAESEHSGGKELVTAVVAAFETSARITLSMPGTLRARKGSPNVALDWQDHVGHSYNVFGAAVGAGRILGLRPNEMANAMGIAGYTAPVPTIGRAFSNPSLSDMKYTAYGWMALSGVLAAQLARDGMTGDPEILDGPDGFWHLVGADSWDYDPHMRDLGSRWWILSTSFKPYPAGTWMRNSMLALDQIIDSENIAGDEIERIVVHTWLLRQAGPAVQRQFNSYLDTQVSYPYLLTMRALRIPANRWHEEEVYRSQEVLSLIPRIEFAYDQGATDTIAREMVDWYGRTTKAPATVEVYARGTVYTARSDYGKGDPFQADTRLSDADLCDKFRLHTRDIIRSAHVDKVLDLLLDVSNVQDVSDVLGLLTP